MEGCFWGGGAVPEVGDTEMFDLLIETIVEVGKATEVDCWPGEGG